MFLEVFINTTHLYFRLLSPLSAFPEGSRGQVAALVAGLVPMMLDFVAVTADTAVVSSCKALLNAGWEQACSLWWRLMLSPYVFQQCNTPKRRAPMRPTFLFLGRRP